MGSCATKKSAGVSPTRTTQAPGSKTAPMLEPLQLSNITDTSLGSFVLSDSNPHSDILKYYQLKKDIGRGQFGSVKLAVNKTHRKFAVKLIPKEKVKSCFSQLQRELLYLKTADHPNTVRLYEVFEDKKNVSIVMDYLAGGELYDRLEKKVRFPEQEGAVIMYKLFHAVSHLHFRGICHRDLKPENFMFDSKREDSEIKIIDFGLGNKFDALNEMHTVVGTPYYVAPEVLRKHYGKECDIWSLGVIMYALLAGFPPFNGSSDQEIQRKVLKGDFNFKYTEWDTISKEAKDLIKNLLSLEPPKRLPANEVLNHPWFQIAHSVLLKPIDPVVVKRLKNYHSGNALRKEALKVICQFVPNEETRSLNSVFRVMDEEHIGFLSQEGVLRAAQTCTAEQLSQEDVQRLFAQADLLQGRMSYTEFVVAALNPAAYTAENALAAGFHYFDSEEKGFITLDDVRKVFTRGGRLVMDEESTRLIRDYDLNSDGKLDLPEFSAMVRPKSTPL